MSSEQRKPQPEQEQKLFDEIKEINSQLRDLKRDRSKFLKSDDVLDIYNNLADKIRQIMELYSPNPPPKKVDEYLDDVFQLLSLGLLTVGHNRKAPATFASLCTVQQLLQHLDESSTYTEQDVEPIKERLNEIGNIIERDSDEEPAEIIQLLKQKHQVCLDQIDRVLKNLDNISPELQPIMQKLVTLRREIMGVCSRPKFSPHSLKPLKEELKKIESKRVDGVFLNQDGSEPKGQATVNGLLEKCSTLISDFSASSSEEYIDPALKPIYNRLIELKNALENLLITHRWTLRETDLYFYQRQVAEIDALRENGIFKAASASAPSTTQQPKPHSHADLLKVEQEQNQSNDGSSTPVGAPKGQSILLYLLRRCYAIIYKLLESSEPVSEALTPIHNQLTTVRRCLLEVKRMGGLNSVRELYPYQMKLASVDQMRIDGKFMVGDTLPEGQGMLNALLAECFDICHELRVEMDEQDQD